MADLSPEQIAAIASEAAAKAVAAALAATGGAQAPSTPSSDEVEPEDARDRAVIEKADRTAAQNRARAVELAEELLPLIMAERHLICFRWMTEGVDPGTAIQQIVRAEVSRRMPDYREAMGGGGSSSRNAEALSERLPRRD